MYSDWKQGKLSLSLSLGNLTARVQIEHKDESMLMRPPRFLQARHARATPRQEDPGGHADSAWHYEYLRGAWLTTVKNLTLLTVSQSTKV